MNLFQQILSVSKEFREHFEKENQQEERLQAVEEVMPYSETRNVTVENATDEILKHFPVFAAGDTITVNVDGEVHSLVAYEDEYDGDKYANIGDTTNSLDSGKGQLGWQIYVLDDEVKYSALEPHTVSYLGTFYHTIDKKYLPIGLQSLAVDGEIALDNYNKTYTLSDGLVFDSLVGKRVLLYDEILRNYEIYYINSATDNTIYICQPSYEYRKVSDEFVLSVTVYLLSSDGKFTDKTKKFILTEPNTP